ncbi:MAG: hypothetical protein RLZZ76_180 [Candidatus Parcubacteria bacterium]|jgi:UDP-N-acetylmuramate dehydrogenase
MELVVTENVPLAPYTTLHVGGSADVCTVVTTTEQLHTIRTYVREHQKPIVVLGGGSNVLVADERVRGLVVVMRIGGISHTSQSDVVYLTAGAGEPLDSVVAYAVERGLWGMENLSHIPGTVGATPVQNVGAYGVEVADIIHEVEVFDMETGTFCALTPAACSFGYRDSLFKKKEGKKYIITSVTFALTTTPNPQTMYKDLAARFPEGSQPTLAEIRNEIIAIRSQKFPDWNLVGTAGSFFKNPLITKAQATVLQERYPEIPCYAAEDGRVKISLGYILDKILGLRGYTEGKVGLFEKQALVLVSESGACSTDIKQFAEKIIAQVKEKIGVAVEMEVTEIG